MRGAHDPNKSLISIGLGGWVGTKGVVERGEDEISIKCAEKRVKWDLIGGIYGFFISTHCPTLNP